MNPGGMENNDGTACMAGSNIHRLPYPRQDTNRPEANTDYEPPAWLAWNADAMAIDGDRVWRWALTVAIAMAVSVILMKMMVWFGGMP